MITFPCNYVGADGTKCLGKVTYKSAPTEMVSLLADHIVVPGLSLDDLPKLDLTDKFKGALDAHLELRKKNVKEDSEKANKLLTRHKRIYLTCDAEAMHVEPYDVPSK